MGRWPKSALFLSGLFSGGGADHLIFIAMGSTTSHYGFAIGTRGQFVFAVLDFGLAAALYRLHSRWSRATP